MNTRIESTKYAHIGVCLSQMDGISKFTNVKSEDGNGKIDAYFGLGLEIVNNESYSKSFHDLVNHIMLSTNAAVLGALGAMDVDISEIGIDTEIKVSDDYESSEIDDRETNIIPIVVHTTIQSYKIDDIETYEVEHAMKIALVAVDIHNDDLDFIGYCTTDVSTEFVKDISKKAAEEAVSEFVDEDEDDGEE